MPTIRFSMVHRFLLPLLAALLSAMAAPHAAAQPLLAPIEISPANAGPGVARQISVRMHWLIGCLPTATIVGSEIARKRTLTIYLDDRQGDVFRCSDLLIPHTSTVTYTPDAEGDLRVLVLTNHGAFVGEATLSTRAANSNRSQYDLTGMWYDPATNGSGLTFVHGATRNDQVFGTWYVYDAQGMPRWYTIQNVTWSGGGLQAAGTLYETRANSIVCVPPYTGCPVALAFAGPAGLVSIVMQGPNNARITAISSNGGGTLTSNLIRSIF